MSLPQSSSLGSAEAPGGFDPQRRLDTPSKWKRLGLKRGLALGWLAVLLVYALFVSLIGTGAVDLEAVLAAPSAAHPFDTDSLGRDLFFRAAEAVRSSLLIAAAASLAAAAVGCVIGALAALAGSKVDQVLMRFADLMGGLPSTLLAAVIASMWPGRGWIELAEASGGGRLQMWVTHIFPPILPLVAASVVVQIPHALWFESTLSFLGLGLPADSASLGLLLEEARVGILSGAWWLVLVPGGLLVVTAISLGSLVMSRSLSDQRLAEAPVGLTDRQVEQARGSGTVGARLAGDPEGVAVRYGDGPQILTDAVLPLKAGTITLLEAPSGEGKTTVLQAEAGTLPLAAHQSKGTHATPAERGADVVYAPSGVGALNPVRAVAAQLKQTLKHYSLSADGDSLRTRMRDVGLDPQVLERYPGELSGGMARCAGLALALATPARIMLIDEPTGGLDREASQIVCDALTARAQEGTAIAIATHDMRLLEAADIAVDDPSYEHPFAPVPVRRCVLHSGRIMDGRSADLHLTQHHEEELNG